jgi:peroxiredoxin
MLAVGASAPDFQIGETTLHALLRKGRAVVFFYPKAFTPG